MNSYIIERGRFRKRLMQIQLQLATILLLILPLASVFASDLLSWTSITVVPTWTAGQSSSSVSFGWEACDQPCGYVKEGQGRTIVSIRSLDKKTCFATALGLIGAYQTETHLDTWSDVKSEKPCSIRTRPKTNGLKDRTVAAQSQVLTSSEDHLETALQSKFTNASVLPFLKVQRTMPCLYRYRLADGNHGSLGGTTAIEAQVFTSGELTWVDVTLALKAIADRPPIALGERIGLMVTSTYQWKDNLMANLRSKFPNTSVLPFSKVQRDKSCLSLTADRDLGKIPSIEAQVFTSRKSTWVDCPLQLEVERIRPPITYMEA